MYAQRINVTNGSGMWTSNGEALCTAAQTQFGPVPVMSSAGITQVELDGSPCRPLEHLRGGGRLDRNLPLLDRGAGRRRRCYPDSVSVSWVAGLRSAILAWSDTRAGNLDIFAQRSDFLGAVGTDFALASNAGVGGKVIASGSTPVNQGASKELRVRAQRFLAAERCGRRRRVDRHAQELRIANVSASPRSVPRSIPPQRAPALGGSPTARR